MADYTLSAKITGDASGFTRAVEGAKSRMAGLSSNVKSISSNLKSAGKSISRVGDSLTRNITMPAAAATSALVGVTLVKGFGRLAGIDTARAKMQGLGHDTESVEEIMESALDSVRGTSFGMDEAATTAANAVAAGIPPGKELTRYLSLTGDAAAIAGNSMAEMGSIINKVQTAQKAYTGDLNQLSDRGIPIYQWLGEEAGVSAEKVRDLASEGKISSEMFLSAIENNIGGAAKIMGETSFMAAIANIGAAISRVGASFLDAGGAGGGFFSTIKPMLTDFIATLDRLEPIAADLGVRFGNAFENAIERVSQVKSWFDELSPSVQSLSLRVAGIAAAFAVGIGPALKIVGMLTTGLGSLAGGVAFLISPVGLVIAGITALAIVFGTAMARSEEFREAVFGAFERVRTAVMDAVNYVVPLLQDLWVDAVDGAQWFADGIGGWLLTAFSRMSDSIQTTKGIFNEFYSEVMARTEDFRASVQGAFETVGSVISDFASNASEFLMNMWDGANGGASDFAGTIGDKLVTGFQTLYDIVETVYGVVSGFVSSIIEGFDSAGGEVSQLSTLFIAFNPVLKIAMMILTEFGPEIAAGFQEIAAMALPILMLLGDTLGQLAATIIPLVMNVVATLIPIIITLGTTIMEIIMTVLPILLDLFMQLVPVVMSLVTTVIGLISQILPLVAVLISSLVPILMMLVDVILNIVQAVAPALIAIIGAVIAIFEAVIPVVMAILTVVIQVMANVMAAILPIIAFVAGIITNIIAIIAPIVTFIAGIIASIFNVITPITTFVSGVFSTVFSIVSGIFQSIMQFIGSAIQTISGTISRLSGVVSGIFNSIWSTISRIMNRVSTRIQSVFTAITNSWTGLRTFVSGVFSGIGDNMQDLVDRVRGFVNGVIGGINTAIGVINKIPGVSINTIPQLYRGTDDWEGGFARVNEGGRGELVHLPNGSQVVPHDVSMRYAREAGRNTSDYGTAEVSTGPDTSALENWLQKIYDKKQDLVLDTGALVGGTYDEYDRHGGNKTNLDERRHR